jgi:hypothetical protein
MSRKYFITKVLRAEYSKQTSYGTFPFLRGKPRHGTGAFLISNLIIEDWVELKFNTDMNDL